MEYCKRNEIKLNFIEKGCPWMNPFIERAIGMIKEEYLNLMWIDENQDEQVILNEIRRPYNRRDNMSLGYHSPLQFLENYLSNPSGV
ncbi:MAG: integrase core domain-containing protein [Candidatus Thermoplasmatota archaeon]|nr:integrase core domain-containing protein [Candidatus Thermoplasmatota archaeon]